MRWPLFILLALLIALQYPLWLGKGGWLQARQNRMALQAQEAENRAAEARNAAMAAEVSDLRRGQEAIEERAREAHGLIRPGEIFVQIPKSERDSAPASPPTGAGHDAGATNGR